MAKDWQAVADAINTRMAELQMTQTELAQRSQVSVATLRQMQKAEPKRRGSRTLAAISEALRRPPGWLESLADGGPTRGWEAPDRVAALEATVADLAVRLEALERKSAHG